ncbi:MAG: DUF1573 domain-containing protein, partial [Thermoguttaceae bacterium]|nr:DUF1573 domain-containing protein [Thermoguttaceae bacterium]
MNAFYYLPILLFSVLFTLLYYKGRIFHGTNSVHGATRKYQAVTGTLFVLSIIFYTFPDQVCTAQTGVNYAAMFKTTSYDFQSVLRNSKAEYQFEFVNQSTRPVHISQAVSSCGCTSVVVETPTVQPGATGTIRAILNTRQFSGQRRVTLTVSFDRPAWGQVQLQIRGYIRNDMELSPRSVQCRVNDDSPEVMEQKAYISQPWTRTKLESARSSCSFLSAKLEAPQYRGKELIYPITLSMKTADVPNGYFKERISVYGSDARNALLVFDVEGVSLSKITASPGTVFFLKLPEKRDNMRKVVVAGQRPFTI